MPRVKAATSERMRKVKTSGTKPELELSAALKALGVRHRMNVKSLPGTPDVVTQRCAVFVHGCFWHRCPRHGKLPKTRTKWWAAKFEANRRRDALARAALRALGWVVVTVWEHEPAASAARRIARL